MGTRSGGKSRRVAPRSVVVAALLAGLNVIGGPPPAAPTVAAATASASPAALVPGVPEPPVTIYDEDFENRPGPTPIVRLDAYIGAAGETYSADPAWLTSCNGWIAAWNQPPTALGGAATQVADCAAQVNWNAAQQLAQALGLLRGQATLQARANLATSAYTFGNPGAPKVEFSTANNLPLATATGRYLTTSIDVAAVNCPPAASAPLLQFQLLNNAGTPANVGGVINACTSTRSVTAEARGAIAARAIRVGTYTSNGSILWNSPNVGVRVLNNTATGAGNDHAFDNIRLVDATPQLDKAFVPATFATGTTSKLTLTITNTGDLASKNGWSFTDNLPTGLIVATPSNAASSCPGTTVTAPAGSASVAVTGNIATGMASCQVTVDVTSTSSGEYSNGPANIMPLVGLNPPGTTASATVVDTDFGDAPATYGTDTASHTETAGLRIGSARDTEVTGQATPGAAGDDGAREDDEDGTAGALSVRPDQAMSIPVSVTNTTGSPGMLVGWIDLNADGDFADAGEQSAPVATGATSVTVSWPAFAGATPGDSFVRLRLYPGAAVPSPTAPATGGEVEDHLITLQVPSVSLAKTASAVQDLDGNGVDAGDRITYTLTVTNDGNVPLDPVVVDDPLLGGVVPCGSSPLGAGANRTCPTVDYTLTQADIDAGERPNTATVTATPPSGPLVSDTAESTTTLPSLPAISLVKSHGDITDLDGNGTDAGDTVVYSFRVTNTGNRPLTGLSISDAITGPVGCPAGTLAPADFVTCTARYVLTQDDVDAGEVVNEATASAVAPGGGTVEATDEDTLTAPASSALVIDKSVAGVADANGNGRRDVGDVVTYSFVVTNSGATTLTGLTVGDDNIASVTCPVTTIPAGGSVTCTATYPLTQDDVDAGEVVNTAGASANPPSGPPVTSADDTATVTIAAAPGLSLEKTAAVPGDVNGNGLVDAGDTIDYAFELENTGNVTLDDLTVADPKVGPVGCPTAPLAPGDTADCAATYTITQPDVDAGSVDNAATASGTTPGGQTATSNQDTTSTETDSSTALELDKSVGTTADVNGNGLLDAGDTVTYEFAVENTGTTTVSGLAIDDDLTGGANCPVTTLAPGGTARCTQTYTITLADVDAGEIVNTAAATGDGPDGPMVSPDSTVTVQPDAAPELGLDKSVVDVIDEDGSGSVDSDDTITYSFLVENTGTVTITDVSIDDDTLVTPATCPPGPLAPGQTRVCTASYTITQADVNAGTVQNSATALGQDPDGASVESLPDSTSTTTDTTSSLTIDKQPGAYVDANGNGVLDAGDTIPFTFLVFNTGTATITGIVVEDPKVGTVDCPITSLDAGTSTTCTADYTATQADVDSGSVDNVASAVGQNPTGDPIRSPQDSTSTPAEFAPELTLTKSVAATNDVNGNGLLDAGDTLDYEFLVENTGTVTTRFVGIEDPKAGAVDCPATTLAPGETTTCSKTYTVTQTDVDAGTVDNAATADAVDPDGDPVVSEESTTSTEADSVAALTIDKTAAQVNDVDGDGRVEAGDTIDYTFLVVNNGTVTISGISIDDPKVGPVTCPDTTLAPRARTTCTGSHEVTQADVDAGSVDNRARALGEDSDGGPVESAYDTTSTLTDQTSGLTMEKTAGAVVDTDGNGPDAADIVAYEFEVENTGVVTIASVYVVDPMLTVAGVAVDCPAGPLAPGDAVTCTATYPLRQGDVDAGEVVNTAYAAGATPNGDPVRSANGDALVDVEAEGGLSLDKSASRPQDTNDSGRLDAGDTVVFTFTVRNTGALTVSDLTIDDPGVIGITCATATLAPGDTTMCEGRYRITQADVEAGSVDNTATASGVAGGQSVTSAEDSVSVTLPTQPAVELEKSAEMVDDDGDDKADAGEKIRYSFLVTNVGATTLHDIAVEDPMLEASGDKIRCPRTTLAAGRLMTCRATYVVTEGDLDGPIRNTASASGTGPGGTITDSAPSKAEVLPDDAEDPGVDPGDDPGDDPGGLPDTGGPPLLLAALGGLCLAGGALLLLRGRRSRMRRHAGG